MVRKLVFLVMGLWLAATAGLAQVPPATVWPIARAHYDDSAQYGFIPAAIGDAEVVALAESIHMTHEFPLVRLGVIKDLHEKAGFRVVAFEGSAVDLWVTQDRLLNSTRSPDEVAAAQEGLFPLWNTPEMRRLFDYEVATWSTASPLYFTAYDIQPGTGQRLHGGEVFRALARRLSAYAEPPAGLNPAAWTAAVMPLTNACQDFRPDEATATEVAIAQLDAWSTAAAAAVERRFPNLPHAAMLRLLPGSLRASLELCRDLSDAHARGNWAAYKDTRDRNAAAIALKVKAAAGGKLILWAHLSHLGYSRSQAPSTVGDFLRQDLGAKLYTIATFAGGGGAIVLFSDVDDLVGYDRIHSISAAVRTQVDQSCAGDCFVTLRNARAPAFTSLQPIWFENGPYPMQLANVADAMIWIRNVHAPDFPLPKLIILSGIAYVRPPRVYVVLAMLMLLLAAVVLGWRLRRRRAGYPIARDN